MPKTVWVLGAGFSRSLGGPLLPQLFSDPSIAAIRARFREHPGLSELASQAAYLGYRTGAKRAEWRDAEDYIEQLDAAAHGDSAAIARVDEILQQGTLQNVTIADIRDAARRLIAAECSGFCLGERGPQGRGEVVQTERWDPYRSWVRQLRTDQDKIITFNYDRVLSQFTTASPELHTVLPGEDLGHYDDTVHVLKLHGSVDWRRIHDESGTRFERAESDFALSAPGPELAIGTPGPAKAVATKEFKPLWDQALLAIAEADSVVFVGYRFPETDALARSSFLDALTRNRVAHLRLHVVLGADIGHRDVVRLKSLLHFAAMRGGRRPRRLATGGNAFSVSVHPMYAEDFLAVYKPAILVWHFDEN